MRCALAQSCQLAELPHGLSTAPIGRLYPLHGDGSGRQTEDRYLGKLQPSQGIESLAGSWDGRGAWQKGATIWAQFQTWHLGIPFRELKSHVGPHAPSPRSHSPAGAWRGKHRGMGQDAQAQSCEQHLHREPFPGVPGHCCGAAPAMGHALDNSVPPWHGACTRPEGTHLAMCSTQP